LRLEQFIQTRSEQQSHRHAKQKPAFHDSAGLSSAK
jgi:hypothetical protein